MRLRTLSVVVFVFLALVLFVWGAERQAQQVNTDMDRMDQDAYRDYAKKLAETDYAYTGDRNRMPLYPLLLSVFHGDGMPDEQFFAVAKQVNIALTVLVLGGAFYFFLQSAPELAATVAILVAAFTMFVYKAPFFQAEVLFYGFSFWLFVLMLELIQRPRWSIAIATGVVGGLAQLTKASVLPAVGLCLLCLLIRSVAAFFQRRTKEQSKARPEAGAPMARKPAWSRTIAPLFCGAIVLMVFLVVLFPYIRTSKARFGHYFYNVNSTFYMWYDSWDAVKEGTRAHGDRIGWPDMPADQLPSMSKYLREHTVRQILERFGQGLVLLRDMTFASYGYAPFLLLYLLFVLLLVGQNSAHFMPRLLRVDNVLLLCFIIAYFASYLLLYAWYLRIAYGNRFVLALFLPALFTLVWVLGYAQRQGLTFALGRKQWPVALASYGVALMLAVYLVAVFPTQIGTMFGGF